MPVGNIPEDEKVFPHRKTIITLDSHLPSVQQQWLAYGRSASEMAQTPKAELVNVVNVPGVGWQLRGLQFDWGDGTELDSAQGGYYTVAGGTLTTASGITEFNLFKQAALVGVTYNSDVASSGSPAIQKRVADTDSWDAQRLAADEAAYPPPFPALDAVDMDRIAKTVANHEPEDALFFTLWIPGSNTVGLSTVANLYFTGPAGSNSVGVGTGQYCLKLRADGRGLLYEKEAVSGDWLKRHNLKWAEGNSNKVGTLLTMVVYSDARDDGDGFKGSVIGFTPGSIQDGGFFTAFIDQAKNATMQGNPDQYGLIYRVPKEEENATTLAPVRIDVRRDVRAIVQVGQLTYPESGTLFDDVFSIPFFPNDDPATPFFLFCWGSVPGDSTLTLEIYDADTGLILPDQTVIQTNFLGQIVSFTPVDKQRRYRIKAFFTSTTDRKKTPTFQNWQILRTNVFETPTTTSATVPQQDAPPALPRTSIDSLSITGQEAEPSQAGAQVIINDFTGELAPIFVKGGVPIKIETTYNEDGDRATIFQGYIQVAQEEWMGAGERYAGQDSRIYSIQAVGEWGRLTEGKSPQRFEWQDKTTGLPYKVTDAVRDMLLISYPQSMVAVPDLETRLFSLEAQSLILEPLEPVGQTAHDTARDYLGAYLHFDESAGTVGKWRMLEQKRPPYNILAKFFVNHPGDLKLPHINAAYGTSGTVEQPIIHSYIRRGTWRRWVEKPEGNSVYVVGGAKNAGGSAISGRVEGRARLTACAVNVKSFNFLGLAPGDPGYPDGSDPDFIGRSIPIPWVDSTLTSQEAVDWMARRIYDRSCHARERLSFVAPMVLVTDTSDTEQLRPRILRYYDAVEVEAADGTFKTYLVMNCSPIYTKDGFQFARYELVRPTNIEDLAVMPTTPQSRGQMILEGVQHMLGISKFNAAWTKNNNQESKKNNWMVMAEDIGANLQNLDNTSPDFGEFYYLPNYDPTP